ncbi:hypothetical protein Pint_29099 [Pistacia integerrima]|uniref:Uncharacterized protein n=1 Tax=Pistacia integerrima TaxID=434235 RepID=A0ACC0WXU7_9ROSI|nr:hypothetical protein Pint_29099 [Pistacia integerrima]
MKEIAFIMHTCSALIITVVFAAAFHRTVGGNTKGIPTFLHKPPFIVFVISMLLHSFLPTRFIVNVLGHPHFTYAKKTSRLPTKEINYWSHRLFFSIASMMVAFGATIYIFLSHPWKWVIIPISLLGCVPVSLFGFFAISSFG